MPATQSSVSRDLEELGVVKHHGHYTLPRTNGAAARGLLSLDHAGDCLVIARTVPGLASAVAEIDAAALPEIVGTIAGEDTIFIAVRDQKGTIKKVWNLFGNADEQINKIVLHTLAGSTLRSCFAGSKTTTGARSFVTAPTWARAPS